MKLQRLLPLPAGKTAGRAARMLTAVAVTLWSTLQAPAAQPPPHNISAANLTVIQNDTGNTTDSVTVDSTLSINDLRVRLGSNRGDYNVQVGEDGSDDTADGFILVTIAENGRDNGELPDEQKNYAAPAFDAGGTPSGSPGNAGLWAVLQDCNSGRAEFNINCSVAYFRYTNWFMGWARNATSANGGTNNYFTGTPGLVLGTHYKGISAGRSRVDLRDFGIDSTTSGVLLVNHAKNEGNYASSQANNDGTWEIYVKDNFANNNSLEQDPAAFVFIPKTNTSVISGKFGLDATGTNATILMYSGASPLFSITNFDIGRYRLTIPGGSPNAGVLVLSSESSGAGSSNFDNTISYEPDGSGWIIEHRDLGVFPPPLEACTNAPVASFVYIPAATAGFTVTPTNTLTTTEFGLAASFSVVLDLAPTNDVTVNVTSSNPLEGAADVSSLHFTPSDWNLPHTVTVTGQNDDVADGNVNYSIVLDPAISGDTNYNGLDPIDVQLINVDDEQAGITVAPFNGLHTTESGGTATFVVFLNRAPTDDVTFALSSSDPTEGTVSPTSLTFTPSDWQTPQQVTVTGVDDFRVDGTIAYSIVTGPATSTDSSYNGTNPGDVAVANADNDTPAVVFNYLLPLIIAEGTPTNFTVMLATQPDSNVVVKITSANPALVTVNGDVASTNTFTPSDWNVPQVITLVAADDLIASPTLSFTLTQNISGTDPLYANFNGNRTLPGFVLDNEVKITLSSGDAYYGIGMPAIGIDGQALVEDVDATTYDTGSVTVAVTNNGTADDRLEIRDDGVSGGQIGLSGTDVTYEGVVIGSFTGGTSGTALVVSLNANSTLPAVQQLFRNIMFGTITNGASLATRTIEFALNDGVGSTITADRNIRVGALRLTQYQEGGDHGYGKYTGAGDIALSQVGHGTPWPIGRNATEGLLMDWPDGGTPNESQVLMRFDDFVGTNYWQVPSNAVIVAAELLMNVNNTGDGARFFRMLIPWDADNDTWDTLGSGVQPDDIEARSIYESQLGVEDGSGATGTGIVAAGVTRDVQAWVNGTNNYGWVMIGWQLRTDGTGISPSEAANVALRPRLRVLWLDPQYETNTVTFQQGVNGYSGAHDTNLRQAQPDVNFGTEINIWSDANDVGNTNNTQGLLRFDDIIGGAAGQIPAGSLINAAILEMPSIGPDAMGDGGTFHQMLQPWDDMTTTWASWGDGIQADDIEAVSAVSVVAGNSNRDPDVQGTVNSFDVTADVQTWVNNVRPNYGWVILPWPTGSNGWGSRSSENISFVPGYEPERERPRLVVNFTAGVFVTPAIISNLTVTPAQVIVPFTGTSAKTYTVLRSSSPTGPWGNIGTATTDAGGMASFTDNSPLPGGALYRVVYP